MKTIALNKIPSIFKNVNLPSNVLITSNIPPMEGIFVVVEALQTEGKKNDLDFSSGRLGKLVKGDIFPGVLGYRKATVEFAGSVPKRVKAGDVLYLLCESGLIGSVSGIYQSWGEPVRVKVLGAIVDESREPVNLKNFALAKQKVCSSHVPIVAFIGSRMDCGKTTMACKVIHHFNKVGKKVSALKATGVAFTQDIYKLKEYGANPVVDFVDMGLASTCNGKKEEVIFACFNLLNYLKGNNPDLVVIEFGDSVIGEYHVIDILKDEKIKEQIKFIVLAAYDFAGVYGIHCFLDKIGLRINLVTGPVVNSQIGVNLINKYFNIPAESNQDDIPETISLIKKILERG